MNNLKQFDVIIIGAGASGLMCAISAGFRGRKVLLIDHATEAGKKIQMSGGGKCNFTNLFIDAENYISNNPHFCKSALSRYTQYDFINLIEKYKISYHEREFSQLFCDNSSKEIIEMLLQECKKTGVKIQTKCSVNSIQKKETDGQFDLNTSYGDFVSESLVIATGGLSIPAIGATGFGYEAAKQFGLKVNPCYPGLVPLIIDNSKYVDFNNLSGISINVSVRCNGKIFKDALLFTHKGFSGPVILQISNYWNPGDELEINLLPEINLIEKIELWRTENPNAELKNLLGSLLPKRLSTYLLSLYHLNKPVKQLMADDIKRTIRIFHHWQIKPSGTEGYKKAEVTKGGVDTGGISSKTFEANKVKGLYFIGEVLDVTGWLGGYNLQWAWSSGYCAGQYV